MKRREFLRSAACLAASLPVIAAHPVFGATAPSNKITIGIIGLGGMGTYHLNGLLAMDRCKVVALCDVDSEKLQRARDLAKLTERECTTDFRHLLERADIDVINIATPDHWHVPLAKAALRAGKSVYLQKPLSLNVREGRELVRLVSDLEGILQTGSQQRSSRSFRYAAELVRNGYLGDLKSIRVGLEKPYYMNPGLAPAVPPPGTLDYDRWLGPCLFRPYSWERVTHFRGCFDHSGGYFSDWGAHHLDIVQWALNMDASGPRTIRSEATFHTAGIFDVPMQFHVTYGYANGVQVEASERYENGIRFEGSDGWLFLNREKMDASRKSLLSIRLSTRDQPLLVSDDHDGNLFDAMGRGTPLAAPAEVGHRSASVCHLGNISMRLGRELRWDPDTELFTNDDEANRLLVGSMREEWRIT